jgi:membrane protein DedA with SNARE-associated domain
MIWTTPACILWAFLYVSIGSGAAGTYRELQNTFSSAGWVFIAIVAVSILLVAVIKRVLHRFADSQDALDAVETPAAHADKPASGTR